MEKKYNVLEDVTIDGVDHKEDSEVTLNSDNVQEFVDEGKLEAKDEGSGQGVA